MIDSRPSCLRVRAKLPLAARVPEAGMALSRLPEIPHEERGSISVYGAEGKFPTLLGLDVPYPVRMLPAEKREGFRCSFQSVG